MKAKSNYKFPGIFKITIRTDETSEFVAGRIRFDTEAQLDKYMDMQKRQMDIRKFHNFGISVVQEEELSY